MIKIQVEKRITRSWRSSIINSLLEIQKRNKLAKKSHYIKQGQWQEHIKESYPKSIFKAASEAFGGIEMKELKSLINKLYLETTTLELLDLIYKMDNESLIKEICDRFPEESLS